MSNEFSPVPYIFFAYWSSLSVWVHACDAMELEEEDRKRLDEYIDQIYVDIEKGKISGT